MRYRYVVNLAPLIDVLFILLAYLLIYSQFDTREVINVDLPKTTGEQAQQVKSFFISIDQDNILYFDGKKVDRAELNAIIQEKSADDSFNIFADRKSDSEELILIMKLLSSIGASSVAITVQGN